MKRTTLKIGFAVGMPAVSAKQALLLSCAVGLLTASQAAAAEETQVAQNQAPRSEGARTNTPQSTAARANQATAAGGEVVEELIVTAKQVEDFADAPVAVTTFTAEQRNLVAANTVADLVNLTPGVTLSDNGMNMRGVGRQTSETATLGTDPVVGYYVNGFYSVVAGVVGESTLYSESVQFLRGPQGTRFGRASIAGVSTLWARRPTKQFQGQAVAQYGENGFWGLGVNVAGPINDRYGVRLGWQHFDQRDSVQGNIAPVKAGFRIENNYFEFQVEGRPTDNLHFWLRSTAFQFMNSPGYLAPPRYNTTVAMDPLVPNPAFGYTTPSPTAPRVINVDTAGADRLTGNQVHILNADYDFGPVTLYYVGGFAEYKAKGYSDADRTSRPFYVACTPSATVVCAPGTVPNSGFPNNRTIYTRQTNNYLNRNQYFTHELRLQNNDTSVFNWVLGSFYLNSDYNERFWNALPEEASLAAPILTFVNRPDLGLTAMAPAAPNPDRAYYSQLNIRRTRNFSVFGDVSYNLNDQWELGFGLRHSIDSARSQTNIRYVLFNPAFGGPSLDVTPGMPNGMPGQARATLKLKNEETTGRATITYRPDPDTMIYAEYARGFRPGGFNLGNVVNNPNPLENALNVFQPDTLNAFEVGMKHTFGPTLRGDATVFYYDYEGLQIRTTVLVPNLGARAASSNIPKSRSYGLELQGVWTPNESLWVSANYSYLKAEIAGSFLAFDLTQRRPNAVTGLPETFLEDVDGNPLPRAPEHKFSVAAAYTMDFEAGSLILGGNIYHQTEQQTFIFNNPIHLLPSQTLANVSITWRTADNKYDLVAQVSNVFDELFATGIEINGNESTGIFTNNVYNAPRAWQVQLRYRF